MTPTLPLHDTYRHITHNLTYALLPTRWLCIIAYTLPTHYRLFITHPTSLHTPPHTPHKGPSRCRACRDRVSLPLLHCNNAILLSILLLPCQQHNNTPAHTSTHPYTQTNIPHKNQHTPTLLHTRAIHFHKVSMTYNSTHCVKYHV